MQLDLLSRFVKGPRFSEKDWYYLQAQTDMLFHYLKLDNSRGKEEIYLEVY